MELCSGCGHQLGVGRFCLNCGRSVDGGDRSVTDTAERPAVRDPARGPPPPPPPPPLPPPPSVLGPPPEVRYPLYADQAGSPGQDGPPPLTAPAPPPGPGRHERAARDRGHGWLPWAVGAAALLLVAAIGGVLLLGPQDADSSDETAADVTRDRGPLSEQPRSSPTPTSPPTEPPIDIPESEPPSKSKSKSKRADVAALATVTTPVTAPPNRDVNGNLVRYEPFNMLDGVPETTWRMPGDGSGTEVAIDLDEPTKLTRVGLINGYAKRAGALDWYTGNRRLTAVQWVFDDGSSVSQSLTEVRRLQAIDIDPVKTRTVTVRLVSVSTPGRGPAGRDYTAISDVTLVGTPVQS